MASRQPSVNPRSVNMPFTAELIRNFALRSPCPLSRKRSSLGVVSTLPFPSLSPRIYPHGDKRGQTHCFSVTWSSWPKAAFAFGTIAPECTPESTPGSTPQVQLRVLPKIDFFSTVRTILIQLTFNLLLRLLFEVARCCPCAMLQICSCPSRIR